VCVYVCELCAFVYFMCDVHECVGVSVSVVEKEGEGKEEEKEGV
jgi:hypothetical protein